MAETIIGCKNHAFVADGDGADPALSSALQPLWITEERLRLATEAAEVGLWDVDPVNDTLFWPPRVKSMFGISPDVPVSMRDFYDGIHPDDRQRVSEAFAAAADPARRAIYDVEYRTVGKEDGVVRWVAAKGRAFFDQEQCIRVIGTAIDVTARKRAELRLYESEKNLAEAAGTLDAMIENAPIGFAFFDRERRFIRINQLLADIHGLPPQAHIGQTIEAVVPDAAFICNPLIEQVFRSGNVARNIEVEIETRARPGEQRGFLVNFFPVVGPLGKVVSVGATVVEITERRRAESALRESEARLRAVIDAAPVGLIFAEAPSGRITGGNTTVERIIGHPILPSQDVADYEHWVAFHSDGRQVKGEEYPLALAISGTAERPELDTLYQRGDGRKAWIKFIAAPIRDHDGKITGGVVASLDIDRERRAEAELQKLNANLNQQVVAAVAEREAALQLLHEARKLESLGQLTGGVAHDFNNLLMVFNAGLDMLERQDPGRPREQTIAAMRQAAERGATLSRQLLTFSRRQTLKPEAIDIALHISTMQPLLDRALRGDVKVELDIAEGIWPVMADATELELAILNLCVNSRDAMPRGGTINIVARNMPNWGDQGASADFVELSITDDGVGMSPAVLARVFEPFFTTKDVGKGSGLGLAQVHGFATQSGGNVQVESKEGVGTTVTLRLRRSLQAAQNKPKSNPPGSAKTKFSDRSGTVLLVEDDPEVALLVAGMLRELGYDVVRASNAEAALGALANERPIDLVFSDIVMPGAMSGTELAAEVKRRRPDLPVLLTTGFAGDQELPSGLDVLRKPYQIDNLLEALERLRKKP